VQPVGPFPEPFRGGVRLPVHQGARGLVHVSGAVGSLEAEHVGRVADNDAHNTYRQPPTKISSRDQQGPRTVHFVFIIRASHDNGRLNT